MRKGIPHSLNSGAVITVNDRCHHGEDSHLSVKLNVNGETIEVICSKKSVNHNGLRGYFSYTAKEINRNADKKYEWLKTFSAKKGRDAPADKRSFGIRETNCITINNHLKTGFAEQY